MRIFKDNEVRETINTLRDIGVHYGTTDQLRSRIADVMIPLMTEGKVPVDPIRPPSRQRSKIPQILFTQFAGIEYQRGGFHGVNGWPKGWLLAAEIDGADAVTMTLVIDGSVYINNVYHEELTIQRKVVMQAAKSK